MLKISILDTPNQRRLMLEGRLIAPWTAELRGACKAAQADLHQRKLVIDLKNLTAISEDGENALLDLLSEGVTFRSSGVFTKHVLKLLARRTRQNRKSHNLTNLSPARSLGVARSNYNQYPGGK